MKIKEYCTISYALSAFKKYMIFIHLALRRMLVLNKSARLSPHKTSLRSVLRGTPMRLAETSIRLV